MTSAGHHGPPCALASTTPSKWCRRIHRLPDAPEIYRALITRSKAAPAQSRSVGCLAVRKCGVWLYLSAQTSVIREGPTRAYYLKKRAERCNPPVAQAA